MKNRCTYTIEEVVEAKLEEAKKQTRRSKSSIVEQALENWLKENGFLDRDYNA